jgi:hypothetical protein
MHPLTGTWTANLEKSKRHANHQFRQATMRIEVTGTEVRMGYGGVNASGKDETGADLIHADGQAHPHPAAAGLLTTATLDSRSVRIVASQGDAVVGGGAYEVSDDGQTMTATVSGTDGSGTAFDQVIVFDRA